MKNIKVLLCEDSPDITDRIATIIDYSDDLVLLESVMDAEGIEKVVEICKPDIVIMDLNMRNKGREYNFEEDDSGIVAIKTLKRLCPHIKILAQSFLTQKEYVIEVVEAGVDGFIQKVEISQIPQAIQCIMEKGFYFSPFILRKMPEDMRKKYL